MQMRSSMAVQKSKEYQQTEEYKNKIKSGQKQWRDSLHGPEILHYKTCENEKCNRTFEWFGRKGTRRYERARFCSISCSKTRNGFWNKNIKHYQVICFKYHEKKCIICEFDKIVAVHHNDENRENNSPLNLIPLCPNHHEMVHTKKYKKEIQDKIDIWIKEQIIFKKFIRDEDGG